MSARTLGALIGPVWIAKRATGHPTMSPFPIIILLCGLAAPMLLAHLDMPSAPAPSAQSSFDRRYFWAETETISPLLAAAQIKRVAAARNVPYFVVRRLVDDTAGAKNEMDITALNLALDRREQGR